MARGHASPALSASVRAAKKKPPRPQEESTHEKIKTFKFMEILPLAKRTLDGTERDSFVAENRVDVANKGGIM